MHAIFPMIEYQKSPVMIRGQRQIAANICILTCREYRQSLQPTKYTDNRPLPDTTRALRLIHTPTNLGL